MIQKYWGQPGCLCLHYIKRTNDGAPLPDSSAIFQRMKKGLCTNAYFSLTRQPPPKDDNRRQVHDLAALILLGFSFLLFSAFCRQLL